MSDKVPFSRVGFFPSFPQPVTPPSTDIKAAPQAALCFNEDWIPLVMGAIKVLMRPETYKGDIATITDAVANASQLVAQLGECETMRTFRQDGCHLYTTLNGIETLIYNGQECIDGNIADGTIAKANSGYIGEIGADQCQVFQVKVSAGDTFVLPNVVNTGDTVSMSGWHGGATDWGQLSTTWICPSGTAYNLGECSNTARPTTIYGTDPLQTAPHLAIIAQIGSDYYDIWGSTSGIAPGTFTVPAGIVNQPIRIMMNIGPAVAMVATGEMWGEVTVCNRSHWCKNFDFTVSDGGWTAYPGPFAAWVSGTGWVVARTTPPYADYVTRAIVIEKAFSAYVTKFEVTFTADWSQDAGSTGGMQWRKDSGAWMNYAKVDSPHLFDVGASVGQVLTLLVDKGHDGGGYPTYSHAVIRSIKVYGTGTNPFGTSDCT